jgi:hypothetical protein
MAASRTPDPGQPLRMMTHAQVGLATYLTRFEPAGSSGGQWVAPVASGRG